MTIVVIGIDDASDRSFMANSAFVAIVSFLFVATNSVPVLPYNTREFHDGSCARVALNTHVIDRLSRPSRAALQA